MAHHWFILATTPNTCGLHRLVYPKKEGDLFVLEEIKRYSDKGYMQLNDTGQRESPINTLSSCSYHANSWLVKVSSNGRYLLAPTIHGQIFVFNLLSGQLTAILKNHEGKIEETLKSTFNMAFHSHYLGPGVTIRYGNPWCNVPPLCTLDV